MEIVLNFRMLYLLILDLQTKNFTENFQPYIILENGLWKQRKFQIFVCYTLRFTI